MLIVIVPCTFPHGLYCNEIFRVTKQIPAYAHWCMVTVRLKLRVKLKVRMTWLTCLRGWVAKHHNLRSQSRQLFINLRNITHYNLTQFFFIELYFIHHKWSWQYTYWYIELPVRTSIHDTRKVCLCIFTTVRQTSVSYVESHGGHRKHTCDGNVKDSEMKSRKVEMIFFYNKWTLNMAADGDWWIHLKVCLSEHASGL